MNSPQIYGHVIPTTYNGREFRSRLEAKAAMLLDRIGIDWQYEPEGFVSANQKTWYCPDFFLPDLDCYLEIKPNTQAMGDMTAIGEAYDRSGEAKARMLARVTRKVVYVAFGFPWGEIWGYEADDDDDIWTDISVAFGRNQTTGRYGFSPMGNNGDYYWDDQVKAAVAVVDQYQFWKGPR